MAPFAQAALELPVHTRHNSSVQRYYATINNRFRRLCLNSTDLDTMHKKLFFLCAVPVFRLKVTMMYYKKQVRSFSLNTTTSKSIRTGFWLSWGVLTNPWPVAVPQPLPPRLSRSKIQNTHLRTRCKLPYDVMALSIWAPKSRREIYKNCIDITSGVDVRTVANSRVLEGCAYM